MKPSLIVFGEDWGGHPSSTQHLIRRIAADRAVVWVNSIGLRRPRLSGHDLRRAWRKVNAAVRQPPASLCQPRDCVDVINPAIVPWPGNLVARRINRALLGRSLRNASHRFGLDRPILWLSLPTAVDAIGAADERAVVYYCGDDFAALAGVDHAAVTRMEDELAARADLILAASPALASKFAPEKTRIVPHGADIERFAAPTARPADLPSAGRIAGYYGSLASWLDLPMLANVARRLSDWQFVFIGPCATDVSVLRGLANVHLLGSRPHASLPAYVQHWDVSLLPFRDTPQIRACNPLKLREYLAGGAPIVSTEFPALDRYRDHVVIAHDAATFAAGIEAAPGRDAAAVNRRRQAVAGETWDVRAAEVECHLDRVS